MAVRKGHIGLLLLLVAALVAVAALYPGAFSSLFPEQKQVASDIPEPAQRQSPGRVPGIPGQRRTHRYAVDKTGFDGGGDEGFPLNVNLEIVSAEDAPLEEDDLVMGIAINGEARAYAINYMMGGPNEVVNDTLGGQPIAPSW